VGAVKVFLDANVLFSAALGGAAFDLLWELCGRGAVELLTGQQCYLEARVNLERKRPESLGRLSDHMRVVKVVERGEEHDVWARELVPEKDAAVLADARAAGADVVATGDLRHFGSLMRRDDLPFRVVTVRGLLLTATPSRFRPRSRRRGIPRHGAARRSSE